MIGAPVLFEKPNSNGVLDIIFKNPFGREHLSPPLAANLQQFSVERDTDFA